MIKIENLNKYFNRHKRNEIHVINNVSYDFPTSGIVAILGPSGSGKTTLLNAISGLDKVSSGNIYIDGVNISKMRTSAFDEVRNLKIGYIFQDYKLIDNLSVYENVALSLKLIGIKDEEEIKKRVLYTLKSVGMERYKNRPAGMLSGGERQRVGIARAIVKNPQIIIADEPTGNLDSKNSLEVMNIIKSISRKYLVILVTHEEALAKFYASHIIEIQDGKIKRAYENKQDSLLNYEIENHFYLKDYKNKETISQNNININVYQNDEEKINLDIVLKNGNLYINSKDHKKIEVVDNNSSIVFIDEHYKEIKKDENNDITNDVANDAAFDIEKVMNKKEAKYSSVFNLFSFISYGFKRVFNYPFLKKVLLGGFFLSGMFIFYAISNIFAITNVKNDDFINVNSNYLVSTLNNLSVDNYTTIENLSHINYLIPGDSVINFRLNLDKYLQSQDSNLFISGSISDIEDLDKEDLIMGRIPSKKDEIVLDKLTITRALKDTRFKETGFGSMQDFLEHTLYLNNMTFTVVGISDKDEPNIYASKDEFINMVNASYNLSYDKDMFIHDKELVDYTLNNITLQEGRLPLNDYEVVVSSNEGCALNSEIDYKINGHKLKVVGIYEDNNYLNTMYVNAKMIKYNLIEQAREITILSNDQEETINYFHTKDYNIKNAYDYDKEIYLKDRNSSIMTTLTISLVILAVSLIEILLMMRSSFLSRIKEVGILRAIGVKKSDIYKMFMGEVIAISVIASFTGVSFMTYILYVLSSYPILKDLFMVNIFTFILSLIIVLLFNLIVGLIPVFNTIRKTPAQILARTDVD